ncbi:MAG: hypothetical protein P8P35_13055 [Planktotalea sp.]|uniref:hypothetical protein n=1 Tax=Planktotalea sp. TaxID=2029877 RepID=UPI00261797BD|nr:hypothetical protein [Planktotalea sp.]MDG1085014.1 hypothetical protein [Planktotalea sp.]
MATYKVQPRGVRLLRVHNAVTNEVVADYVPQNKLIEYLPEWELTPNDVKNIPHQLAGKQKKVKGLRFELLGTITGMDKSHP